MVTLATEREPTDEVGEGLLLADTDPYNNMTLSLRLVLAGLHQTVTGWRVWTRHV